MDRTIGLSMFLAAASTTSAFAADARNGETLAKRWCATCHIVASDQQRGSTQWPPFSVIANKPDFNETTLAYFLLTPASAHAGHEPFAQRGGRSCGLHQNTEMTIAKRRSAIAAGIINASRQISER